MNKTGIGDATRVVEGDRKGFEAALDAIRDIEGWLTEGQARLLYDRAAALAPASRIIEIGSFHGRSTIVLALAAPEAQLVSIDPYVADEAASRRASRATDAGRVALERFEANLERAGVRHRVEHVREFSSAALGKVQGAVDLLYIDGAHDPRSALADVHGWGGRVREGGTMLIHDAFSSVGVTLAQLVRLFFGAQFRYVGRSRSLAEYRRESIQARTRVSNAARQTAQLPWFARNVVIKVALVARARPVARALGHSEERFPY